MIHTLLAQSLDFRKAAQNPDQTKALPYSDGNIGTAIGSIIAAVMAIGVLAAFIFIVTGAFEWITSGGEKGKVESARNKITGAVIGLIVLACTFVIIILVQNFLGIEVFTFGAATTGNSSGAGVGGINGLIRTAN